MRYDYDVIAVGGRVAGASTAMLLARRGHRVLVVDRVTMPADSMSTHALLRTAILQLTRWGLLDTVVDTGAPAVRRIMLGFGHERVLFEIKPDHGIERLYAPRRYILDTILLDAAIAAGTDLAAGTRVVGLRHDSHGRVVGVETGDGHTITARYVVGADGVRSRIAELAGAETVDSHGPSNAIHYAYFTGVETPGYWFQFSQGVNAGMIPTNDGAVCVFAGRPRGEMPRFRATPNAEFRRLLAKAGPDLAERLDAAERITGFRGTPGLPGFVRRPWGPGWVLVGDAGYAKDPISAHGISGALRDAELCANAIDEALRTPDLEVRALLRYETQRNALSAPIYRESKSLAQYHWTTEEASGRMRRISDAVRAECDTLAGLPVAATLTPAKT